MSEHEIKTRINTKHYEVLIFADAPKGYFEHHKFGDERGGGLWFERVEGKTTLIDYDGVACLPREVWEALEGVGIVVEEEFK